MAGREMPRLLSCPFCGGEPSASVGQKGDGTPWHYIECLECAASAEPNVWNARTTPQPDAKALPAVNEAFRLAERDMPACTRDALRPDAQPAAIAEARREGMESAAQKCQDFAACFFNGTAAQAALIAAANMIRTAAAATAAQKEGEGC